MNKLFTKIAGGSLAVAMMIGVGVGLNVNKQATKADAAVSGVNATYELVESDLADWSGTYIIYSTQSNKLWDASSAISDKGTYVEVTPSNKKITTDTSYEWTISKIGDTDTYSIRSQLSTNPYIKSANKSVATSATAQAHSIEWKNASNFEIKNGDYYLRGNSGYIRYYSSSTQGSTIALYKKVVTLTGIELGGAATNNALSIGSSDLTNKTINVSLTPSNAKDQRVDIVHQSGTENLFTVSSSVTCTSGSGSFTVTGTGATSGSETFRIKGHTETNVYVDLVVTALNDSSTYYDVSFNSNGGSESPAVIPVEDGQTFEFPSAGTKEHYSFDGWTSTGSEPYYAAGTTSPVVTADIEYTAHWTEDAKYVVTYTAGTNGSGSYLHANNYAGSYELLAFNEITGVNPNFGYRIKDYTVNDATKKPGDTINISGNTNVTVNFEVINLEFTATFGTANGDAGLSNFNNTSYSISSGITLNNIQGNLYGKNDNTSSAIRFGKSGTTGSFDVTVDSSLYIKKVTAGLKYYSSDSTAEFAVTPNGGTAVTTTLTNEFVNYTFNVAKSNASKVTLGTTIDGKRAYLSSFTVLCGIKTPSNEVANSKTQTQLSYHYSEENDVYTYSNISIRFGGVVDKLTWDALDGEEGNISGFGVMITTSNVVHAPDTIATVAGTSTRVLAEDSTNVDEKLVDYYMSKAEMATPPASGDNYVWNLFYTINATAADDAAMWKSYVAAAYIKVGNDYVFFKQVKYSAGTLAMDYLANRGCDDNTAGGSLKNIKDNSPLS